MLTQNHQRLVETLRDKTESILVNEEFFENAATKYKAGLPQFMKYIDKTREEVKDSVVDPEASRYIFAQFMFYGKDRMFPRKRGI